MKNIILLVIVLISPHTLQQYEKTLLVFSRPDDVRKSNSDFFHNAYHCTVVVARCPSLVVGQARESVSAATAAAGGRCGAAQGPTRKRDDARALGVMG